MSPGGSPATESLEDRPRVLQDSECDAFVSYSHKNQSWVLNWLLPRLKIAGLRICVDVENFALGAPLIAEIERAIIESRKTIVVLSPAYLASEWAEFEAIMARSLDPSASRRRVIPIMLEACELPLHLRALVCSDFTVSADWQNQLGRLIEAVRGQHYPEQATTPELVSTAGSFGILVNPALRSLCAELADLFTALGWRWEPITVDTQFVDLQLQTRRSGESNTGSVLVRCLVDRLGKREVETFLGHSDDERWLVVNRRSFISAAAMEQARSSAGTRLFSLTDLYEYILDVRPVAETIIQSYKNSRLDREYTPLSCQVPRI